MASATYVAIDAHSAIGEFKLSIDYDTGTLQILDASCFNTTGDVQHVTVNTRTFDVPNGFNATVDLSAFNLSMVNGPRGPQPPLVIG